VAEKFAQQPAAPPSFEFRASYINEVVFSNIVQLGDLKRGGHFVCEDGRTLLEIMCSVDEDVNRHHLFQDKASGGLLYSQQ